MSTMPANFPLEDYRALAAEYGYVEFAGWTSITLTGGDRQAFLHNFCTNDVKRLKPSENCEAFVTNVKGKTLGHGLVHCRVDELLFITVPGQAELLLPHFERYVIREDVQLRDTTEERRFFLVSGGDEAGAGLQQDRWIRWRLLETPVCGLLETTPANADAVRGELAAAGARECAGAAFEALRVEAGMPLFGRDFSTDNLPQEVSRDAQALSFTKGCYLGQETVARIDALGHVNEQLTGVQFADGGLPKVGTPLVHEGTSAGRVTSASYSPALDTALALAMIRRQWLAPGTLLESEAGQGKVVGLPLPR